MIWPYIFGLILGLLLLVDLRHQHDRIKDMKITNRSTGMKVRNGFVSNDLYGQDTHEQQMKKPKIKFVMCHKCADAIFVPHPKHPKAQMVEGCKLLTEEEFKDHEKNCPLIFDADDTDDTDDTTDDDFFFKT